MKIKLTLFLLLTSFALRGQNDTTIYLSNLERVIPSKEKAAFYYEIKREKRGDFRLKKFQLIDNNRRLLYELIIRNITDSSYIYYASIDKKKQYLRRFTKAENGYHVRDYFASKLIEEGFTNLLFPTIKNGQWIKYTNVGKIREEGQYKDNQLITNKYLASDGSYVNDVFTQVDRSPEYEGGAKNLLKYINENTNYPMEAREKNISGRVIVGFMLMKDGTIRGIDFYKRVHYLLDMEALRIINSLPNKWEPAEINGQKVNTITMIPITFTLQ